MIKRFDKPIWLAWLAALLALGAIWTVARGRGTDRGAAPSAAPNFSAAIVGDSASLGGSLVFVEERAQPNYRIAQIDFASGAQRTLLAIPEDAFAYQIAPGGDGRSIVLAYSAPPGAAAGEPGAAYDRSGIYRLDLADGQLTRLLGDDRAGIYYAHPQITAEALYYEVHQPAAATRRIERYDLGTGRIALLAEQATMPVASPAGSPFAGVAYFRLNPQTQARSLWLASAGGPIELVAEGAFADLDTPVFAPDGRWLYFTAPIEAAGRSWLEKQLLASGAGAHGNHARPARWYRLALGGSSGAPEPASAAEVVALGGAFRGATLGFVTPQGFSIIDGQDSRPIVRSRAMRSFVWMP